jgi:hypothetical protein
LEGITQEAPTSKVGVSSLSGYNTSSKEEKAEYDEKALCKFMGKSMFVFAFCVFLWGLSELIKQPIVFGIGIVLFIGTVIFIVIYTNTKNRFKK